METPLESAAGISPETKVKHILEWLALAHGRSHADDCEEMLQQLFRLRDTPLPTEQRVKLLDLLYVHAERIVQAELPRLSGISLPVSRKIRQRVRLLLELLETLTQDYFNNLAGLFDPAGGSMGNIPQQSLRRAVLSIAWQIRIFHLVAAPPRPGIWQQLHAAFRTAKQLQLHDVPGPRGAPSIQRLYMNTLLAAIAQPASFSSEELEFISEYVDALTAPPELVDTPPRDGDCSFWIDLERDIPAHALIRRSPGSEIKPLYFSCAQPAGLAASHRAALAAGTAPDALGLPPFAGKHAALSVLRRLEMLWGNPAKRRFSRRRQSYRVHLCTGFDALWKTLKSPDNAGELSEWMVINESPDGYALMHMSGTTNHLRIGDIVSLRTADKTAGGVGSWNICIIRWAISENPEHVEIGLQLVSSQALAVHVAHPQKIPGGQVNALILPECPPLRQSRSLIVRPGQLKPHTRSLIVLIEQDNLEIREMQTTDLNEQTSSIEIFTIDPEDAA